MKNLLCKIFGHKESVIWHMDKLTGIFCTRCKTWTSSKHYNGATKIEHEHEWLVRFNDMRYRDIEGREYVIDVYQCSCGAGGEVKTPLETWKKGNKKLGIEEFSNGRTK